MNLLTNILYLVLSLLGIFFMLFVIFRWGQRKVYRIFTVDGIIMLVGMVIIGSILFYQFRGPYRSCINFCQEKFVGERFQTSENEETYYKCENNKTVKVEKSALVFDSEGFPKKEWNWKRCINTTDIKFKELKEK